VHVRIGAIEAESVIPQDLSKREYYGGEMPENGILSRHRPAQRIVDFVRASKAGDRLADCVNTPGSKP
jgi:hypothetical protein